jgi:poly(A) polymerase
MKRAPDRGSGRRCDSYATLLEEAIDPGALETVLTLQRAGHTTYLVGGGVRDLLLGRRPKDFDIATMAPLADVRGLFARTRRIGRRFPILHVQIGRRTFEVARFRRREPPAEGDSCEPLQNENCYGTPEEDARARDFTVNGLFYDPGERRVIDFVGGLDDLRAGLLRSIGAPEVWYYEDPVRILRAARFAGKLGFTLPEEERLAMGKRSTLLKVCPGQRVTDELFKILESGGAAAAIEVLWETGVLADLMPELECVLDKTGGAHSTVLRFLTALDTQVRAHRQLPRDYLFTALNYAAVWHLRRHAEAGGEACLAPSDGGEEWLSDRLTWLPIPRACRVRQRAVMRLAATVLGLSSGRGMVRLVRQPAFPYVMALLRLHERCFGGVGELYCALRQVACECGVGILPDSQRVRTGRPSATAGAPEPGASQQGTRPRRTRRRPARRARGED